MKENLLLSALICSSDIIAAISLISSEEYPKLASIVFGEGITNDAVSIILYKTVYVYTSSSETFTPMTPVTVSVNFLKMGISSVLLGVLIGIGKFFYLRNGFAYRGCLNFEILKVLE